MWQLNLGCNRQHWAPFPLPLLHKIDVIHRICRSEAVTLTGPTYFIRDSMQSSWACFSICLVQVWLQEFAWTEEKQCELLSTRNHTSGSNDGIKSQPMFCFETAMKAFYWSGLVYDSDQVSWIPILRSSSSLSP